MRKFWAVVMLLLYATCFSSTHAQTKSPLVTPCPNSGYTMVDGPYDQLVKESDPEKRLVMLDNYVAQYKPKPSTLVYIYPLYFQSYLLRVRETVYNGHFDQPKTKRSVRTIPIGTETAEILSATRPADVDPKALVKSSLALIIMYVS
jgi:hypothetical protein